MGQSPRPLIDVARELGLSADQVLPWGRHRAKIDIDALEKPESAPGRVVLVSAITPTPAGEGKTTTSIGLAQGLRKEGARAVVCLREPSLGPCFGVKGGGTGGGQSKLLPSAEINLHFTGDFHAVAAAHNLLSAALDNHLHHGNALGIDPRRISWPRVVDMNDRSLRSIALGLGGLSGGVPREGAFDITAASEVMAVLCLARDRADLRDRLGRMQIARTYDRKAITADQLGVVGAMLALLEDARLPNLVQTTEGAPALVHGGPFANIAHGCNSIIATNLGRRLADWVVTEAGFGMDLGGEKFFDIKCGAGGVGGVAAVVIVATVKALKMHGGVKLSDLEKPDAQAVGQGLGNLEKHLETVETFGKPVVVTLNRFAGDTAEEVAVVRTRCQRLGVPFAESDHFTRGGEGARELARAVMTTAQVDPGPANVLYPAALGPVDKIRAIVRAAYGGRDVLMSPEARRDLSRIEFDGIGHLPICMAKTPASLSDDPKRRGRPRGFDVRIKRILANTGAGFLVVLTGDVIRMPGLPRRPAALDVDVVDGAIIGVG
ncbi:MAG: formate--tetrahydrofolate ligase [Myxococcota bacterium]|nr:formate--tetrahydrofolate ligase [Myxococcota bacterium]